MRARAKCWLPIVAGVALSVSCLDAEPASSESGLTSTSGELYELEVVTAMRTSAESEDEVRRSATSQLIYLTHDLEERGAGAQFGLAEIDELSREEAPEGGYVVEYRARMPVVAEKRRTLPSRYAVALPVNVDIESLAGFDEKYAGTCGEAEHGLEHFWYDFDWTADGCHLADGDVVRVEANVVPLPEPRTPRFPEQHRFWDDGQLEVLLVHGTDVRFEPTDVGVEQFEAFMDRMVQAHPEGTVERQNRTYSIYDHRTLRDTIPRLGGGTGPFVLNAMLAEAPSRARSGFDRRYAALSETADVILYSGHSDYGAAIEALSVKATVQPNHYQVLYLDGCSTFSYLDSSAIEARIGANGVEADPEGTRFLDVMMFAQPSPWSSASESLWTVTRALSEDIPQSYRLILFRLGTAGLPLVYGEHDNEPPSRK